MESVKIQAILDLKNEEFEHEMDESEWKKIAPEKTKKKKRRPASHSHSSPNSERKKGTVRVVKTKPATIR